MADIVPLRSRTTYAGSIDEKYSSEKVGSAQVVEASDNLIHEGDNPLDLGGLKRGLKGRHVVFISLGSIIGPGTFYGLGYGMTLSGPVGCLVAFAVIGVLLWVLMQGMGETTVLFPIRGGWVEHAGIFVDPAAAFATAWLYYFMWGFFLASEYNSAALVLQYWVPVERMPEWAWFLVFYALFNIITTMSVGVYGEIEFFMSSFKFLAAIVIFVICIVANTGGFGGGYVGFRYFKAPYGPFLNGITGFGQVFILAAQYYVGTEILSLNAGETKNPRVSVPQGVISIVYRIFIVYVGLTFFQGLVCPSTSDLLLSATSVSGSSPFTIGFALAGWASAGQFVNTVIIITFVSAANGCVYVMSRALHSMAMTKRAPAFFGKTTKKGVPLRAILFSNLWFAWALMVLSSNAGAVFGYFNGVCGTACFISWIVMMLTHIRMRKGAKAQGISHERFPYKAPFPMWIYYLVTAAFVFLLFIQGFASFLKPFAWRSFITDYITFPTWIVLYFGFKYYHKTKIVRVADMDFSKADLLEPEEIEAYRANKKSRVQKIISALQGY